MEISDMESELIDVQVELENWKKKSVKRLVLKIKKLNGQMNQMGKSKVDTENIISKHAEDNHIKLDDT
jgi:hypothetical protein